MLTRIRNALARNKVNVSMPSSGLKEAIAKVLQEEGFVEGFTVNEVDRKKTLAGTRRYHDGEPVIEQLSRGSRPGRRMYCSADDMPRLNSGLGVIMISTSKGVMSDRQARSEGIGGELICSVC
jgi:small subunit ribosomal protein S8